MERGRGKGRRKSNEGGGRIVKEGESVRERGGGREEKMNKCEGRPGEAVRGKERAKEGDEKERQYVRVEK